MVRRAVDRLDDDVTGGVISGSPSERLITFIPSSTAASIPATISAELPSSPNCPVGIVSTR